LQSVLLKILRSFLTFVGVTLGIGASGLIFVACSLALAGGAGVVIADDPTMGPSVVFVVGKDLVCATVGWWFCGKLGFEVRKGFHGSCKLLS
jgi:hypothetical protein